MLKVYIEVNVFEEPLLMEVADDAPIERLIPALVQELDLPKTDLLGGPLVYVLRHFRGGNILPAYTSLGGAGVQPETYLVLEPYTVDEMPVSAGPVNARNGQRTSQPPTNLGVASPLPPIQTSKSAPASRSAAFYSDQTIADASVFPALDASDQLGRPISPALPSSASMREKRRTRRTFMLVGGAALGVAGLGIGYAAFSMLSGNHALQTQTGQQATATPVARPTATPKLFVPTTASRLLVFQQHRQTVRTVTWSPNGTLLASGANDALLLTWDLMGQVSVRKGQANSVRTVAWSPNGALLAAGSGNQVIFFNAQSGAVESRSTRTHRAAVTSVAWSTGQPQALVSTGLDKLAVVWNAQSFTAQAMFKLHTTAILGASWAAGSQIIGTGSQGGVIRIWAAQNGQQVHGFYSDGAIAVNAMAFNPTGTVLAAGGADGILRLWKNGLACQIEGTGQQQGQCLDTPQRLQGHTRAIVAANWSPDGRFLATAGNDGQVLVWYPAQSQTPLLKIQQAAPVLAVAWSPDGRKLASASGTTITLWTLA